mmetsp:Transcript_1625/g.5535  ORF Transcript_1625/g.5535 Transcript_1625/m.5535 type:complete len:318 (-) Transcript_1625:697-1650(-)
MPSNGPQGQDPFSRSLRRPGAGSPSVSGVPRWRGHRPRPLPGPEPCGLFQSPASGAFAFRASILFASMMTKAAKSSHAASFSSSGTSTSSSSCALSGIDSPGLRSISDMSWILALGVRSPCLLKRRSARTVSRTLSTASSSSWASMSSMSLSSLSDIESSSVSSSSISAASMMCGGNSSSSMLPKPLLERPRWMMMLSAGNFPETWAICERSRATRAASGPSSAVGWSSNSGAPRALSPAALTWRCTKYHRPFTFRKRLVASMDRKGAFRTFDLTCSVQVTVAVAPRTITFMSSAEMMLFCACASSNNRCQDAQTSV